MVWYFKGGGGADPRQAGEQRAMSDNDKRGNEGPNTGVVVKARPKTRKPAPAPAPSSPSPSLPPVETFPESTTPPALAAISITPPPAPPVRYPRWFAPLASTAAGRPSLLLSLILAAFAATFAAGAAAGYLLK